MNTFKKVVIGFIIVQAIVTGLLLTAQQNYNNAVQAAYNSEGSDLAIEQAMLNYGFNVAWYDDEPTATEKIKALFNQQPNGIK